MHLLTKTPLNRYPVRYMKKWPTYQETGFSLYYVFKMKKSQNVKDFVKIEGRERGIFYIGDKMYLETDLRHPKFDTFRMPAAQQQWMLENADPRAGPEGINDQSIFYRRFLWFWAAGVVFFFGLWNELQKVDFLHSEGRRNRTLSWYGQRIVDDISYLINVVILGKPREDYLTEMMKLQTPGQWFGSGADVSCGSALMDYQNKLRNSGSNSYAAKLQAHEDRLQKQKEKEEERKLKAAESARKAQEAREAKLQIESDGENND